MTGKQCIYSETTPLSIFDRDKKQDTISVFVARPFRENISTCHTGILKPYLKEELKKYYDDIYGTDCRIEINDATDVASIGAITCEKICRPIQESHCIIADVSLPNPNVMYELGLALGLGKDIIMVAFNTQPNHKEYAEELIKYIEQGKEVLKYPGSGKISGKITKDSEYIIKKEIEDSSSGFHFVSLSIIEDSDYLDNNLLKDIALPFHSIVEGSIDVAIKDAAQKDKFISDILEEKGLIKRNLDTNHDNINVDLEKCEIEYNASKHTNTSNDSSDDFKSIIDILKKKDLIKKNSDTNHDNIEVDLDFCKEAYEKSKYTIKLNSQSKFESIRTQVDKAFCCIIDLAGESPLPYLWLGYCHARGINAIPIYRNINPEDFDNSKRRELILQNLTSHNNEKSKQCTSHIDEKSKHHILAFDIRALWYINYENIAPSELTSLLSEGFSELIRRDLPHLEKNRFWNRLTQSHKIHIFTGAIHSRDLDREMVGDWDQRTVSELVRYLASTDSTVTPELEPPVYALRGNDIDLYHEAVKKYGNAVEKYDAEIKKYHAEIKKYHEEVEKILKGKDSIIVGSADVNALTEILLAHAYLTDSSEEKSVNTIIFPSENDKNETDQLHTVIALKSVSDGTLRQFSMEEFNGKKPKKNCRGFLIGDEDIVQQYYHSQIQSKEVEDFYLLSHFLIMQNPFPQSKRNFIVILNGVSGPGTCALAEILTGGSDEKKNLESEKMLKSINEKFAEISDEKARCVQGIVKVHIGSDEKESAIYDQRKVNKWEWCEASANKKEHDDDIVKQNSNPWTMPLT